MKMTKSYRLIRYKVSRSLLILFIFLISISVIANYTLPQKNLKQEIETEFTSDTVAAAKIIENYFGYVTDILMSLALNRDLSNILSMPENDRVKVENIASYNLILSILKDSAQKLKGDLLVTILNYSLYIDKKGKVQTKTFEIESNFKKLAVIGSDIPVDVYANDRTLNFKINVVNLLSFKKIGEIDLYIPKSNLEKQIEQFKKKYNVVLQANNSNIIGNFIKDNNYIKKSTRILGGTFTLYLQTNRNSMYMGLRIIQILFVIVFLFSIILTVLLAFLIARIIMNPLFHLNSLFLSVKEKDFSFRILKSNFKDEIEYVFDSFKKVVESLKKPLRILKDICESEYFDNKRYVEISSRSDEIYNNIFKTSNTLIDNFQYQDKLLEGILDEIKTYYLNLGRIEESIKFQMAKLRKIKEFVDNKVSFEFDKLEENISNVKKSVKQFNQVVLAINSVFNELKKLINDMDLRIKALKLIELSAKIEVTDGETTKRYNVTDIENIISNVYNLVDKFRNVLLENENINRRIAEDVSVISKTIEKSSQFIDNASRMQQKSLISIDSLFYLLQVTAEEIEILKQKTDDLAKEIEDKKKDLTRAMDTVENILNKCFDLKYQVETVINETNTINKLIEETKKHVSTYKI